MQRKQTRPLTVGSAAALPGQTVGLAAGIIVLKGAIIVGLGLATALSKRIASDIALWLAPPGEFALVLVGAAIAGNLVAAQTGAIVMLAATVSMLAVPVMMRISDRRPRAEIGDDPALAQLLPQQRDQAQVLVIGYGRVGQLVGEMLQRHQVRYIAIDRDPTLVANFRKRGTTIFYGDASRIELLRRCGIETKRSLPGIGHPIHKPFDPRVPRLFEVARVNGFGGPYIRLMELIAEKAKREYRRQLPINATGPPQRGSAGDFAVAGY